MQLQRIGLFVLGVAMSVVSASAQENAFLGKWNITGNPPNDGNVYWLEVKNEGAVLSAMFLNRGGSPVPATDVKIADGALSFALPVSGGSKPVVVVLHAAAGKLTGNCRHDREQRQGHRRQAAAMGSLRCERDAHVRKASGPFRRDIDDPVGRAVQGQTFELGD